MTFINFQPFTVNGQPYTDTAYPDNLVATSHISSSYNLAKTDRLDKGRYNTNPLPVFSQTLFPDIQTIVSTFYDSHADTIMANDICINDIPKENKFVQNSKRRDIKENEILTQKYIIQADLKDQYCSQIIVDFDRHSLNIEPTAANQATVLRDMSLHFGTVLWARSYSKSDVFKGRMVLFINDRTNKRLARAYLEYWLYETYQSTYVINHHEANWAYFAGVADISTTHIGHEMNDGVFDQDTRKCNIYFKDQMQIYQDGELVWEPARPGETASIVPQLEVKSVHIAEKYKKYGNWNHDQYILPKVKYQANTLVPVRDILSTELKQEVIKIGRQKRIDKLMLSADTKTRDRAIQNTLNDKDIHLLHLKEFGENSISANSMIQTMSGEIMTVKDALILSKSQRFNASDYPNRYLGGANGYYQFNNGVLYDHGNGNRGNRVQIIYPTDFDVVTIDMRPLVRSGYIQVNSYSLDIVSSYNLDFIFALKPKIINKSYLSQTSFDDKVKLGFYQARVGLGKSHSMKNQPNTLLIVPTNSIAVDLYTEETGRFKEPGYLFIQARKNTEQVRNVNTNTHSLRDIPKNNTDTLVMTHSLFQKQYNLDPDSFHGYDIVFDEATEIFKSSIRFNETMDTVLTDVFKLYFKSALFMTAVPKFWEQFKYYINDYADITVRVFDDGYKFPTVTLTNGFTGTELEIFKNTRTIVACGEKSKQAVWANLINADIINADQGQRNPDHIDLYPDKNFVFNSVMKSGYSFHSDVTNFIVDAVNSTPTGVEDIYQYIGRSRTTPVNIYILHSLKKVSDQHRYVYAKYTTFEALKDQVDSFFDNDNRNLSEST